MGPAYPSDLSDAEFAVLAPALPAPCARGRPWKHPLRAVLDGVFYVVRTGCQWRCLPCEYPPWPTVYRWFSRWRRDGTWERLNAALRERVRRALGRGPQPSAGIIDSQSVQTSGVGGVRGPTFLRQGRSHGGIICLPQTRPFSRLELRAALILDWLADQPYGSQLFLSGDLQRLLERGLRFPSYGEEDIRHALGRLY
jgi:transposase